MLKKLPKIIVILGPTASGKTDLAIKLAKKFNGEIISADSRQVYKEMNIGTAKPSKKELEAVPHHLIDIINPNQEFNVAVYKNLALKAIKETKKRGKIPFLVGGTGLYIKTITNNISFPRVPAKKEMRKNLEKKSEEELLKIYKKLDPEGAKLIDSKNKRRLIRAIEVSKITGKPFWEQRKQGPTIFDILILGIKLPKKELEKRIKKRVEKMLRTGLEKEAKKLIKKYGWKTSAIQTIGYQEWRDYFKNKISKKEVKEKIKLHTIQFTKRQMTWFSAQGGSAVGGKKEKKIQWVNKYRKAEKLIKQFLKKSNKKGRQKTKIIMPS